ncbi:MAG: sigma-70 family RNA polymerase sigma factor [Planctomycetes bacterium]|nr:sigma-70 family RNA polymerase sigma factor [Planctomycetota bacterium]
MELSPKTRPSLIARLKNAQDHEAWSEFLAIYEPLILCLMRRHGFQECDARDACQQVLAAVARDVEKWRPDGAEASFRRWLFRIARNRAVKLLVQQRKRIRGRGGTSAQVALENQPGRSESLSAEFAREHRRQVLLWAAEQIRGEYRESTWQAFWRTCIVGRPIPDVAAELGVSVGNVYVARSRIIARLREKVQGIEEE